MLVVTPLAWSGTVKGVMQMKDGQPMAGGKAIIFDGKNGPPPQLVDDGREPDFVADLNKKGAFKFKLSAGKYYFGAVQWVEGRGPGKPEKGDSFFLMRDQPVVVPAKGLVDLGTIQQGEKIQ